MSNNEQENTLASILGIDEMSEEEQEVFIERVGSIVLDATVGRLLVSLDEDQVQELENYFDTVAESDDVFLHLIENYPQFEAYLQEEVAGLQSEAKEVLT